VPDGGGEGITSDGIAGFGRIRTHMKKWVVIAAGLVGTWLVVDTGRELVANETIQYFASEPQRLLYVAVLAIAGGFAALGFARLTPRAQQQIKLFAWGAAATNLTVLVGYFAIRGASLASQIVKSDNGASVGLLLLFLSGTAAYLWFEFYQAFKTPKGVG
jgi:hypothetical protein